MVARSVPTDGDVIVGRERRDGTLVYVLHTAPGPDQHVLAKRQGVRAWLTDGADAFVLLENIGQVKSTVDE